MLKTFIHHIAVVLCKKRLQKTAIIRKMKAFFKYPKMATKQRLLKIAKNGHQAKAIDLPKSLIWVKAFLKTFIQMHKNMLNIFLQHIAVVLCKKRLQTTVNIRKMRAF